MADTERLQTFLDGACVDATVFTLRVPASCYTAVQRGQRLDAAAAQQRRRLTTISDWKTRAGRRPA